MHLTLRLMPCVVSKVKEISLLAVKAVVFTTMLEEPAGIATKPSILLPQLAGDAFEKHCPVVDSVMAIRLPSIPF